MKKLMALVALALLALAASQFVATGGAAQESSINRRVAVLEKKVRTLQASTKVLKTKVNVLIGFAACLANSAPIPSARFGGYLYTPDHGTTVGETTAVDVTDTGETPQAYIVTISSSCLGSLSASKASHVRQRWAAPRAFAPRARP